MANRAEVPFLGHVSKTTANQNTASGFSLFISFVNQISPRPHKLKTRDAATQDYSQNAVSRMSDSVASRSAGSSL